MHQDQEKKNISDVLWEDEYDYDDSSSIANKPVKENEVNEAQLHFTLCI